jgi:drug/metabolite transporter (DMT)-like permease
VIAFSFSLPATKLAVADLDPWFVAFGRATVAALLAVAYLAAVRAPRPTRDQWRRLAYVAGGVVVGFPLFTSLALTTSEPRHGAVVGHAPAGGDRAGRRALRRRAPRAPCSGSRRSAAWSSCSPSRSRSRRRLVRRRPLPAHRRRHRARSATRTGGVLSREPRRARTISWALVLSAPVTLPIALVSAATVTPAGDAQAWAGFAYVSVISMYLGFFAWYAGLARGGVARSARSSSASR